MPLRNAAFLAICLTAAAQAQSTAFTYQGQLKNAGQPASGLHDLRFSLFDAPTSGTQLGATLCADNVTVTDGLFTVELDFGQQFGTATPANRHLEISVRPDIGQPCSDQFSYVLLSPRQALTAAPMANHALSAFALNAADGSPASAVIVDIGGKVGIGTQMPTALVHAVGDGAALRLEDDGDPASFVLLDAFQPGQARLNNTASASTSLLDLNPLSLTGTGNAHVRLFRETNTTGIKSLILHSGNNTGAVSALIGVGGTSSAFQLDGGNVGIGTVSPVTPLHVRNQEPVLVLQDSGTATTQSGYVGFWNASGVETAWMGFGTPGSPHMTMFNGRSGGDIVLDPGASGDVRLGAAGPRVTVAEESLRLVRGSISAAGSVRIGAGFTSTRNGVGQYTITFAPSFTSLPAVVVGGNPSPNFSVMMTAWAHSASSTGFQVRVVNSSGSLIDLGFDFVAIGPR